MFNFRSKRAADNGWTAWLQVDNNVPVPIQGPFSIGRSKTNTLALSSEKVSRLHALIHAQEAGQYWVIDLGSSNGTYLNGRRVVQPTCLKDNDAVQIGEHRLAFSLRAPTPEEQEAILQDGQLTVREFEQTPCWFLTADIDNLVALGSSSDADTLARIVGEWFATCHRIINEHQGTILQYLGDGLVAYWDGRKIPGHETKESIRALKEIQADSPLKFRLAAHFGKANIAASPILGDTGLFGADFALLLQIKKIAKASSFPCVISEAAYEALSCPAEATRLGSYEIAGFAEKQPVYGL